MMKNSGRWFRTWIIFAIGLSLASPVGASTTQLHKDLAALRAKHQIPVLAYSLLTAGSAANTRVLGAAADTPLRWGSNTKTITALTLLQLAEASLIDLNAPLLNYLKAHHWQNPWRQTDPIRVIHLLELTAGFSDVSRVEFDHNQPISLKNALALNPGHRTSLWPPGLQHSYTNMAPGLSQLLIETVTGLSYSDAASKYLLQPLGMTQTDFSQRKALPGGFKRDGTTPIPYWHMTFPAYGAMNAPIDDIGRLALALLNQSKLISQRSRDRLFKPKSNLAAASGFGFDYASGFYPRVRNGLIWHGHGGDADGYRSRVALLPAHGRGYIALINTDNPSALRQIEHRIERYLQQQLPPATKPKLFKLEQPALQALTGRYYPASARFGLTQWRQGQAQPIDITISDDGGSLVMHRSNRRTSLLPVAANQFRRQQDPTATVAFVTQGQQLYLQGTLGNYFHTATCPEYARDFTNVCTHH